MKNIFAFSRVVASLIVGGTFVAIILAGTSNQSQAASPPSELQQTGTSDQVQVAAESSSPKPSPSASSPKVPCDDSPPGLCYSTGLAQPNNWNCTAGSACSVENGPCGMGKTCKTTNTGGTCFCSCM